MLHVTEIRATAAYRVWLCFNHGSANEVDLSGELDGSVFRPFCESALFRQVRVDREVRTIVCPTGADLASEFLRGLVEQRSAA